MIVMKFGGSSLLDYESFMLIASIISENHFARRVVVLSAAGGVTDFLLSSIEQALGNEESVKACADAFQKRHMDIINKIEDLAIKQTAIKETAPVFERYTRLLRGIAYTREITPRIKDEIVTLGERMAVRIMKAFLSLNQIQSEAVDSDAIPMESTGLWGNGSADLDQTRRALPNVFNDFFEDNRIPLVTGFFGRDKDGMPIAYGRGGTDYSAAVIADALNAERLEIWKDVNGFLSASPEIVPDGKFLSSLSYDEAAELSYFGAKILHPRTVEPLLEKAIPIVIRNTFKPEGVGTWIGTERFITPNIVKSITFDRNVALMRIHGVDVGYTVGLLAQMVSALSRDGINIRSVMTAQTCINILIDQKDCAKAYKLFAGLHPEGVDQIEPRDNIALVALVGEGLAGSEAPLASVMAALNRAGKHAELIVSGASKVAAYFIVRNDHLKDAVAIAHKTIFG